jgi:hypothetical protein
MITKNKISIAKLSLQLQIFANSKDDEKIYQTHTNIRLQAIAHKIFQNKNLEKGIFKIQATKGIFSFTAGISFQKKIDLPLYLFIKSEAFFKCSGFIK